MSALPGDAGGELSSQAASDEKRSWMTAEEFLAQVEAHRSARLKERQAPRKAREPRLVTRVYGLNPDLMYVPKSKAARHQEAAHE